MIKKLPFLTALAFALAVALSVVVAPVAPLVATAAPSPSKAALKASVKLDKKANLSFLPVNYGGKYVVVASFGSTHKTRAVSLQYKDGSKWKQAASAKMDSGGRATFTLKKVANRNYRAVADTHKVKKKTYAPARTPVVKGGSQWKRVLNDSFSGNKLKKTWTTHQVGLFANSRLCSSVDPSTTQVKDGAFIATVRPLDKNKPTEKIIIAATVKAAQAEQKNRKQAATAAAKKLKGKARTDALKKANAMTVKGCPDGVFYNARVDTRTHFQIAEGMVSARVKFPKDQGIHGSIWLQTMRDGDARPAGAEIDMIESFGYGKGITNILHVDTAGKGTLSRYGDYVIKDKTKNARWWDNYHVYSVEWTPSEFIFRVDGIETSRIKKKAVKGDRYYLVMSLLSSDWETPLLKKPTMGAPGIKKAALHKAKMYVDWIQAWERS